MDESWTAGEHASQLGHGKAQVNGSSSGADDGIRTRDPHLGKVVLYQLSHVRVATSLPSVAGPPASADPGGPEPPASPLRTRQLPDLGGLHLGKRHHE